MHTSQLLKSTDFRFICHSANVRKPQTVHDFIPAYHEKDRLGIVTPYIEDGLAATGAAVLAICTAFYDRLRKKKDAFFDYPQHFAFMDVNAAGVNTQAGRRPCQMQQLGAGWGHLDVWPESQWIASGGGARSFLQQIFAFHIHRLFWPQGLLPIKDDSAPKLPAYARRLLRQRLRSVYFYNSNRSDFDIECSPVAHKIIQQSQINLTNALMLTTQAGSSVSRYQRIEPAAFIELMDDCFQPEPS